METDANLPAGRKSRTPWAWVPTLYFAEGIPYIIVNTISVILFKRMGLGNADVAFYTSLLYLPWVIKPLWSPFVDVLKSKRWWILSMQLLLGVGFALTALSLPSTCSDGVSAYVWTLIFFYLSALSSATHDIAADGFYMLALDSRNQSVFVGIRSTFYRIATVFGNGLLVLLAGWLELRLGDVPKAWKGTMILCSALMFLMGVWHLYALPKVETAREGKADLRGVLRGFGRSFYSFFAKDGIGLALVFMLLYRLPEAFSVKMLSPFMLDTAEAGGLGLDTQQVGLLYGTVGVVALTAGGILGGLACAKWGLHKSLWPMALSLALPCGVYLYMAMAQPASLPLIGTLIALDQFGYGFGFTAYMLYLIWFSEGEFKTSHYALCTGFMALSMMLPGLVAGYLQQWLGYTGFFVLVMVCCVATVGVTFAVRGKIDKNFGK
ncbi:MAG: MFS transporter [Bacteroidales bacterium]|nr:MFS transporter [Bacteroidales bacterium]